MKKFFLVSALVLLLVSMGSAKTLDVWLTGHSNEQMRIFDEIIQRDWVSRTGIDVDLTVLSWGDFEQRFLLAAASGEGPDVAGMGSLFAPELGLRGAVLDLTQFPDFSEVRSSSFPQFYRSVEYKGAVFAMAFTAGTTIGYARTDLFENMGLEIPVTWADLKRDLPRMQARGSSFALTWGLSETVYSDVNMFMWQYGGDDYTDDLNRSGYDSPESIAGFREFVELYTSYKIPLEMPHFQGFSSGDLAMVLHQPSFYTSIRDAAPQLRGRWQMVLAPGTPREGGINHTTTSGIGALSIYSSSKMKQEAWEFIKWITSTEVQVEISRAVMAQIPGAVFIPSTIEGILQMDWPEEDKATFLAQIQQGTASVYGLVAPRHRRRYLQFAAQEAITLGTDPEATMRKAASEHNSEIQRKQHEYSRFISQLLRTK